MFSLFGKVNADYDKIFFELNVKNIDNNEINLKNYKNKTILLVNVASKCGFTKQYSELQLLYEKYKEQNFIVLGVPSNEFGGQEPGTNEEIKNFCQTNFNITFPITDKLNVKGDKVHEIYSWAKKNHGNSAVPKWNFHKILINKNGKIEDTFSSMTKPMSKKIINNFQKINLCLVEIHYFRI
jgi:glutathione peroxidase